MLLAVRTEMLLRLCSPTVTAEAAALAAGAICFLTKPFDRLTLIKCLDTALQRHGGGTSE